MDKVDVVVVNPANGLEVGASMVVGPCVLSVGILPTILFISKTVIIRSGSLGWAMDVWAVAVWEVAV